jgi:VWFA-related protein
MTFISSALVIVLLLTNLICGSFRQTTQEPQTVKLTLTITDKSGRYLGGLKKEQITVLDQERPQEIISLTKTDLPVSVGFLFDASILNSEVWKVSQDSLLKFMADSNPANEYFLMAFDSQVHLATSFTNKRDQMSKAFDDLRRMKPSNNRNLYDAIQSSLKTVEAGQHAKRAIILVAGKDVVSSLNNEALLDQLKRTEVLLYAIPWKPGDASATVLKELTSVTGGAAFSAKTAGAFADSFEIISLELKHQYTVEYKSESSSPGAWHSLKFEVKPLRLIDAQSVPLFPRSRAGYYSRP